MKLLKADTQRYALATIFAACFVLLPLYSLDAASSIITETNTNASTGPGGKSSVDVSHTTVINGERSSYYYASTTENGSLTHHVVITDTSSTTSSALLTTANYEPLKLPADYATSTSTDAPPYMWAQFEALLNYLYLYVEQLF